MVVVVADPPYPFTISLPHHHHHHHQQKQKQQHRFCNTMKTPHEPRRPFLTPEEAQSGRGAWGAWGWAGGGAGRVCEGYEGRTARTNGFLAAPPPTTLHPHPLYRPSARQAEQGTTIITTTSPQPGLALASPFPGVTQELNARTRAIDNTRSPAPLHLHLHAPTSPSPSL